MRETLLLLGLEEWMGRRVILIEAGGFDMEGLCRNTEMSVGYIGNCYLIWCSIFSIANRIEEICCSAFVRVIDMSQTPIHQMKVYRTRMSAACPSSETIRATTPAPCYNLSSSLS